MLVPFVVVRADVLVVFVVIVSVACNLGFTYARLFAGRVMATLAEYYRQYKTHRRCRRGRKPKPLCGAGEASSERYARPLQRQGARMAGDYGTC